MVFDFAGIEGSIRATHTEFSSRLLHLNVCDVCVPSTKEDMRLPGDEIRKERTYLVIQKLMRGSDHCPPATKASQNGVDSVLARN